MSEELYRQCVLMKDNTVTVGWIPDRGAKVGAKVEILPEGNFWTVIDVGDVTFGKSIIRDKERMYKKFQGSTRGGGIDE